MCVSNDRQRRVILVTILLGLLWRAAPDAFADTCCPWSQVGNLAHSRVGSSSALLSTGLVLVAGGFGVQNDPKKFVEMYNPATGQWSPAKPMNFFRAHHTASLLHNGKVLVAGGFNGSVDAIASAELYDPVAGTWTTTGSLNVARTRHSATLLADGRVLVAGGDDGADLMSCEVYDPATGQWTPTGSLNVTRSLHSATRLPNGKVLAVGGRPTKSAELYDPQTGNWALTGFTNQVHFFGHTATLLRSGYVLLVGGTNVGGSGDYVSTVELYSPGTGTWSTTASLPEPRGSHSATLLPDGGVLIAGGITSGTDEDDRRTYVYRLLFPPLGSWTSAESITVRRFDHTATLLTEGRVLIAAGKDNPSAPVITEVYNPAVTDHDPAGPMTIGRRFHSATILPDGRVLMAGGQDPAFQTLSSAELFDPVTGLFQPTGAMAVPRRFHTATLLPTGQVLVSGGTSGGRSGTIESSAELYDPASGQWLMTDSMNAARHSHTATLLDGGQVLVLGGTGASGALAQGESYDPNSGFWTPLKGPLLSPRSGHTTTMLGNGRVVAVGGNTGFATAEVYNPETGISVTTGPIPANHRVGHTASLLPNGLVLVAGGFDGSLPRWEASLFQPRTATWSATDTMFDARTEHTATLLPNGRVLMIGGSEADQYSHVFTEEYDPAAGKFALTLLVPARQQQTATLLLNGKVLLAGGNDTYYLGSNTIGIIDSADVYDEGRRPPTSLLPTFGPLSPTSPGATLAIVGTGFAPPHEGSSGRSQSASPANYPLLVLQREDNEGVAYAPVTVWGASFLFDLMSATVPATMKRGWYHARVVVNGVPSASRLILIQ